MAHISMALAVTALLLALVGSVSAQDSPFCLTLGPYYLIDGCSRYLTVNSVTTPGTYCCFQVEYITTNYGTDCLCQIVSQGPINPSEIPGRAASLATLCNSNADMSNCTTPTSAPSAATSSPPPSIFLRPPPPPGFEAPWVPTASDSKGTDRYSRNDVDL